MITTKVASLSFSEGQVVVLVIGVLGLLVVTAAADVLARGLATGLSEMSTGLATQGYSRQDILPIDPPLAGSHITAGKDPAVEVVAVRRVGAATEFMVVKDNKILWLPRGQLTLGD